MEEKKEKSYKMKSLLLTILTRVVQIGIVIFLFRMIPAFFEVAEAIFQEPRNRYDRGHIVGIGFLPLCGIIPAWLLMEHVRYKISIRLSGKTDEEFKEYIIGKTPPEVMEKAKSYEANSTELNRYLKSVKNKLGFTNDEITFLYSLCIDLKKDRARKEAEKRRAEEEEKAKREEERREYGPSFSERIRKEAEETSKQPEDIQHNNPL